jgi:hypothetical protein
MQNYSFFLLIFFISTLSLEKRSLYVGGENKIVTSLFLRVSKKKIREYKKKRRGKRFHADDSKATIDFVAFS